jgi:hypothetical protein
MKPLLDFQRGILFGFEAPACRVVLNPDLGFERKLGNHKAEPLCLLEFKTPLLKSSIFKRSCQNRLYPEREFCGQLQRQGLLSLEASQAILRCGLAELHCR